MILNLLLISILMYLVCFMSCLIAYFKEKKLFINYSGIMIALATIAQILALIHAIKDAPRSFLPTFSVFLIGMSILLNVIAIILDLMKGMKLLYAIVCIANLLNLLVAVLLYVPIHDQKRIASLLLESHIILFLISFIGFEVAFMCSLINLIFQRSLKHKKRLWVIELAPPLEVIHKLCFHSLLIGFLALTAGVFAGYYYAWDFFQHSNKWRYDPKLFITSFTWLAYLVTICYGFISSWRARTFQLGCILCFSLVILTLFTNFCGSFHWF